MDVYQTRKVLESRMVDRSDIYRRRSEKNIDGTTAVRLSKTPIATDVPSRISFIRYRVENPSDKRVDENPIEVAVKIFFPVMTDIKAGDKVVLRRMSSEGEVLYTYSGMVGLPATYDTHTEVMLDIDTSA